MKLKKFLENEEVQNLCKDFFEVFEKESRTAGYEFIIKKYPKLCEKVSGKMDYLLSYYKNQYF